MANNKPIFQVLISHLHYADQLKAELHGVDYTQQDLIFYIHQDTKRKWVWPNTVWLNPKTITIESIKDGSKKLSSAFSGLWQSYSPSLHRRTKLIEENLKVVKSKRYTYQETYKKPFAEWLLLNESTILYATQFTSAFPKGEMEFEEDKVNPPSRAYLKLWEVFTTQLEPPNKNEVVMDLGACPGGWTWVLQKHALKVISVDKAPLAKEILASPNVTYIAKDAFKLDPSEIPPVSWLFSDIACFPDRLTDLVNTWLKVESIKNFVCTVKLQDRFDQQHVKDLQDIAGSKLIHLYQNKNELTWILQR